MNVRVPLSCHFFLLVWKGTSEDFGSLWESCQVYHQARVTGQGHEKQTGGRDSKTARLQQRSPRHASFHSYSVYPKPPVQPTGWLQVQIVWDDLGNPNQLGKGLSKSRIVIFCLIGCRLQHLAWEVTACVRSEGVYVQLLLAWKVLNSDSWLCEWEHLKRPVFDAQPFLGEAESLVTCFENQYWTLA